MKTSCRYGTQAFLRRLTQLIRKNKLKGSILRLSKNLFWDIKLEQHVIDVALTNTSSMCHQLLSTCNLTRHNNWTQKVYRKHNEIKKKQNTQLSEILYLPINQSTDLAYFFALLLEKRAILICEKGARKVESNHSAFAAKDLKSLLHTNRDYPCIYWRQRELLLYIKSCNSVVSHACQIYMYDSS